MNSKIFLFLLIGLVLFGLVASPVFAQTGGRTNFVFHIYVDPIHGSDGLAYSQAPNPNNIEWYNPKGPLINSPGRPTALQNHPLPSSISGVLQQAPFSFRTVGQALLYIQNNFGNLPCTIGNRKIDYIIIHCLPGLYGPTINKNGKSVPIDPKSGIPYNGEQFPLLIPARVSIQGSSALDTIFDAREHDGSELQCPAVNIFVLTGVGETTRDGTFIDSVGIRGARTDQEPGSTNYTYKGAGIRIGVDVEIHATISNCFIYNNTIGVALLHDPNSSYKSHCIIANNTIGWNQCGIWSGYLIQFQGQKSIGLDLPMIVNNVLDTGDPYIAQHPWAASTVAPFLGLHPSDLTVTYPSAGDFNAFEKNLADYFSVYPQTRLTIPGWPPTSPRGGLPSQSYSPRVDLMNYTRFDKNGTLRAGNLYINDILRNCTHPSFPAVGRDLSPHDFRLAPYSLERYDLNDWTKMRWKKCILVDQGILPPSSGNPWIQMANDNNNKINPSWPLGQLGDPPGLPLGADDVAVYQAWDWDCEGFGNPRVVGRTGFSTGPPYKIDLGADEMDELIMGGFIESTRIFSRNIPNAGGVYPHQRIYFFNLAGTYRRPIANQLFGQQGPWWNYCQRDLNLLINPYPPPTYPPPVLYPDCFTKGVSGSTRNGSLTTPLWSLPNYMRSPFMDNLECDFSPHLLNDMHPYWAGYFSGSIVDVFGANPWYNSGDTSVMDNPYLYYDPGVLRVVADGTINPPGTYLWGASQGYLVGSTQQFGPIGYTGGQKLSASVPPWGIGDIYPGGPDYLPDTQWFGVRFNCQNVDDGGTPYHNMQTFLVVEGPDPTLGATKGYQPPSMKFTPLPGKGIILSLEKRGKAWIKDHLKK